MKQEVDKLIGFRIWGGGGGGGGGVVKTKQKKNHTTKSRNIQWNIAIRYKQLLWECNIPLQQ